MIMRFKVRDLFSSLFEYPIILDSRYLMRIFVRQAKIIATKIYYNTKYYQNYNRRKFMFEIKCCYNQSGETNQTFDFYKNALDLLFLSSNMKYTLHLQI